MSQAPSILVMDEDTEILERLQTALQREGYQVRVAVDGRAALRLIQTTPPDLIVSELLLASINSYEVWRAIRADRSLPHIPILVLSALTIPPNNEAWRPTPQAEWQLLSYDAVLPKPVDLPRFVRLVKTLLQPDQSRTLSTGPSTILAIENEDLRHELARMLHPHNFGVGTPETLDKALQWAKAIPPAALILDYRTPTDVVKSIARQAETMLPNTLLILIIEMTQPIDSTVQAQCHGFLTTPFHPYHTITQLKNILEIDSMRQRTQSLSEQLIGTSRNLLDVREQLQAQNDELEHINSNLREIDSQRERLTSITVHDLKSPLGSILGTFNFLLTDPDLDFSEINKNLLNGAMAAGNQMLRMIETMLDRYRLETGKFEAYPEPFDLSIVLEMSMEKVEPFLVLHSLDLKKRMTEKLPLAYADANVVERVLENLLDNAIKYAPGDSDIVIDVIADESLIKITVEDQGPGIPDSERNDIFEQLAELKRDKSARTGFVPGLIFCRLAARAMGGDVWVESDGEVGAKFIVTLPTYEDRT